MHHLGTPSVLPPMYAWFDRDVGGCFHRKESRPPTFRRGRLTYLPEHVLLERERERDESGEIYIYIERELERSRSAGGAEREREVGGYLRERVLRRWSPPQHTHTLLLNLKL